jgi:hypothetical protein
MTPCHYQRRRTVARGVLLAFAVIAGCSVTGGTPAVRGSVRDTLLLDISTAKFLGDKEERPEIASLYDGRELEVRAVPDEGGDDAAFRRAFQWQDQEEERLRWSVAGSLDALDQDSLYKQYLDPKCGIVPVESVRKRPLPPPARFSVSPSKRFAIYQPEYVSDFDLAGLLVDLQSRTASAVFCRIQPVVTRWSPDGRFVAYGTHRDSSPRYADRDAEGKQIEVPRDPHFPTETLTLVDAETGKVVWRVPLADAVEDLTWARSSDKLVVLEKPSRWGFWPWEILAASAGHPIPHDTLSLEWFDRSGALSGSAVVARDLRYGRGRLRWTPGVAEEASAAASR